VERIWSTEIGARVGERVRLAGWLHRLRQLSNLSFLILRDARGLAQIVVEDPALIEQLSGLHAGTVLAIEGLVVAEPQAWLVESIACTVMLRAGDCCSAL
jgi:nondiscriminating aspartyl-tRNA synthetase